MNWLQKLGEHSRAIAAFILLASTVVSGLTFAASAYIESTVERTVSEHVDEFRTEWRCAQWNEELERRLVQLPDITNPPRRVEMQNRIDRLRVLIIDNRCSRFDY